MAAAVDEGAAGAPALGALAMVMGGVEGAEGAGAACGGGALGAQEKVRAESDETMAAVLRMAVPYHESRGERWKGSGSTPPE